MVRADTSLMPGSVIGLLGGGQLGRMFTEAAHRMGYRIHVLAPSETEPACQIADRVTLAAYGDIAAVEQFAKQVSVITYEFENVPAQAVEAAGKYAPVRPGATLLHVAQHRLREKTTLKNQGLPVTPFMEVLSIDDCRQASRIFGFPMVLKTAMSGYDGKGQCFIRSEKELDSAWGRFEGHELIIEKAISFTREISVVAARGVNGEICCYDPFENDHHNHILNTTLFPARIPDTLSQQAMDIAKQVMECLSVVGVMCVEFFVEDDDTLYINEIAPRPHNSGHVTINACEASQFEQQVRAICGLPLGSVKRVRSGAMGNLLGDLWQKSPNWPEPLSLPGVSLHLYGKTKPKPGRKMGHITALADDVESASQLLAEARERLRTPLSHVRSRGHGSPSSQGSHFQARFGVEGVVTDV